MAMVDVAGRGTKSAQEIRDMLEAPFEAHEIKQRQGSYGKSLSYLEGHTVFRRLNEACNTWDFVVAKSYFEDMVSNKDTGELTKVMIVEGHLTIPELGTRAGTGVQALRPGSGEDLYKAARTDAIKNAASLFGVGLDLYDSGNLITQNPHYQQQPQQQYGGGQYQAPQQRQQFQPGQGEQPMNQPPQQGGFQKATGDRVPGGATVRQVNAIHAIAKQKGIDDQSLAMMLADKAGVNNTDDLTSKGASGMIDYLNSL